IAHELRRRELPVRCVVRDLRKASKLAAWGCELVVGDTTDAASLRRAAEGCDRVVHLVAIRQGREEQFRRVMVDGTRHLLAGPTTSRPTSRKASNGKTSPAESSSSAGPVSSAGTSSGAA